MLACFYWNTSQSAPGSNCSFGESMSFIKIRANYKLVSAVLLVGCHPVFRIEIYVSMGKLQRVNMEI